MSDFELNATLEKDSLFIRDFETTTLRLINNASIPWCIVIPRYNDITHLTDLNSNQQINLVADIDVVAATLKKIYSPDRVNIGMLGNIVPQMHWHVIARCENDPAWPGPVWGNVPQIPYDNDVANALIVNINNVLDSF